MIKNIDDVLNNNLCVSCGACVKESNNDIDFMDEVNGIYKPIINNINYEAFDICPGKGYPIIELGRDLFPNTEFEDIELGRWKKAVVAHSLSDDILKNASSGGVMTSIAKYLLDEKLVDGVVTTKLSYGESGPRPISFIATRIDELLDAQGSKYAPVPIFEAWSSIDAFDGKLLFIGTPCQIAALRLLQEKDASLKEKIPLTVGNFCGGYRDLRETDKIIERTGLKKEKVSFFRYRGGGQPGSMMIKDSGGNKKELSYPGYAKMTGIIKNLRCRLCVDATAELADFSCGDAWIPKYLKSDKVWSIILARSSKAVEILSGMERKQLIKQETVSIADIKKSQEGNLTSKKVRQANRMKLYKLLGYVLPIFDGGYHKDKKGFLLELKIHFSHSFFSFLEKIGLYEKFTKLIGRYPKEK